MVDLTLPDLVGQQIGKYKIVEKKGEGMFGITYKAIDTILSTPEDIVFVAIKVLKPKYQDSNWKEEARRAGRLRDIEQIAFIIEPIEKIEIIKGQEVNIRCLVWQYVNGEPLENHIIRKSHSSAAEFIIEIIRQLCLGIKAMQDVGLEHGDLHSKNILLVPPKPYEPPLNFRVKIVDFGLAKTFRGDKFKNDMEWITILLKQFWDKNRVYIEDLEVYDKKFNQSIPTLIKQLEDQSLERKIIDPIELINHLEEIRESAKIEISSGDGSLKHPFEYLSAEEMPEKSDLLYYLYSSNLPWYNELECFGTVVISGPRGSGKSMVLKNLRLQTKIMSKDYREKQFMKEKYVGFYIHCHNTFYLPFAGYNINYSDEKTQQVFIHYINILFTHEVLSTLKLIEQLKLLDITTSAKINIVNFIQKNIFQGVPLFISGIDLFSYLITLLEKESILIQKYIIDSISPSKYTTVNYLNELCNLLKNSIEFFRDKQIYFVLDDYSIPKVREEIQKAFNRIVGVRNNLYCFKISTEKFSFIPTDFDLEKVGKWFVQDREFSYIDLGGRYLSYPNEKERKEFVKEIINKRLQRTPTVLNKDAISLFGTYKFPEGDIAKSLIADKRKGEKKETLYAGLNIIYSLCGGDIYTILELCKEIYNKAIANNKISLENIDQNIPFSLQDKAVRDFSKGRLDRIKEILSYGQEVYHLVEVFGEIAKTYLYEYGRITKEEDRYYEILRIEIVDSGELDNKAFELYKTILLEGIFTDAGGRYPWGKGLLNNCFILRPIYTPALQISYRRRECLRISVKRFEDFLLNPDEFKKVGTKFLKRKRGQTVIFDKEENGFKISTWEGL